MPRQTARQVWTPRPADWPARPIPYEPDGHAISYDRRFVQWTIRADRWIMETATDVRQEQTCREVMHFIVWHTCSSETDITGGPLANVSVSQLGAETGHARATIRRAIEILTQAGGPLRMLRPARTGERCGDCYGFVGFGARSDEEFTRALTTPPRAISQPSLCQDAEPTAGAEDDAHGHRGRAATMSEIAAVKRRASEQGPSSLSAPESYLLASLNNSRGYWPADYEPTQGGEVA